MENEIAKPVTLLNTPKGLLLMILAFCVSGPIAMICPLIFGTQPSFVFGAISFFVFPFICFPFIKKICTRNATLLLSKGGFEVHKINEENNIIINWAEIESYQLQPFKALAGKGFVVKINCKNDQNFKFEIIDSWNIYEEADNDSVVILICKYISNYNKQHIHEEDKITLLPGFFASESGVYLFWLPVLLLIFDLLYRLTHPMIFNKDISFFFFIVVLAVGLFGQRKKSKQVFEKFLKLSDAEHIT